ncbi:ParB/RepB/Spo0J family partition protein [Thauera butanivorans]|uniref:ParB/RepB/Spo0J family partition protein n=1 Tax=Thauera butanivorans TaxID=86174 RepID=UPI0008382E20|nr:ParB/RepB/Spo0J family partition protein [Thauera butanivorans]
MEQTLSPFAEIALQRLAPSPTNPRKTFADLDDLAASIREQGVMQPILVRLWPDDYPAPDGRADRPAYEIVAGERRYRAAQLAGLDSIPALVRPLNTRQVLEAQIVENLQRRDVTELEEAEGYQLMMRDHGYTADQLAEKVGKSRAYIYGRLKLTALCETVRERYRAGDLDASRALLIARIPVPALQEEAADRILDGWNGPLSYRAAAQFVQNHYMLDLKKAPFPVKDAALVSTAGDCTHCPKRAGNSPELFPDVGADVCTDPKCYADKKAEHIQKQAKAKEAQGHRVITGEAARKLAPHGIYGGSIGNEYVALDHKSYYGDKETTARKAIKGQDVPVVMIEDVRSGALVPAVARKDLNQALKAVGIEVSNSTRNPRDLAREKARKQELAFRRALFDAHHQASRTAINMSKKPTLSREDLALVTRQFWASRGSDACKKLARMYVPDVPERREDDSSYQDDDYRRIRRMTEMIGELSEGQLVLLLLDLSLVGTLDVPTYLENISTPEPLLDAVRRAGLDPESVRAKSSPKRGNAPTANLAPPPTTAPQGGEGSGEEKTAAAEKAAPAGGQSMANPKKQAATAARKAKAKTNTSGRAAAGGKGQPADDPPGCRCPNTLDMLEAQA